MFLWSMVLVLAACGTNYIDVQFPEQKLAYAPDESILLDTQLALDSLSAATGLIFYIDKSGTPIHTVAPMTLTAGDPPHHVCANTYVTRYADSRQVISVSIDVETPQTSDCGATLYRVIEHEIIHSIRSQMPFDGHAKSGVFKQYVDNRDNLLNYDSLTMVCEAIPCLEFNPETSVNN